MVIKGIGIDIEDISRFRRTPFKNNRNFYEKIYNPPEIKYCLSKTDPYQHFAVRFCAKEAFIKAMDTNNKKKTSFPSYKDISIVTKNSKPLIICKNKKYLLSLSHDKDKAVAIVVIE